MNDLDTISKRLRQGDRRDAVQYARDRKMWAHALLMASSVGPDCWREVVGEFLQAELASSDNDAESRGALRMSYALLAGLGGASGEHQDRRRGLS